MNTTSTAPRLRASIPTAPVPAKRSTKRAPATSEPSTLKSVSRKRSLVGRSVRPLRLVRKRLRYVPAIARINTLIGCRMSALSADAGEMIPLLPLAGKREQGVLQSLPLGGIINQCKGFPPREFKQFAVAQRIGDVEAQVPGLARAEKLSRTAELEIGFRDLESIGCAHHGLEPRAGFVGHP